MPDDMSSAAATGGGQFFKGLRALLFGEDADQTLRGQIEDAIAQHEDDTPADGDLSDTERTMLRNLLDFGDRNAGDIGVPRSDIIAVAETVTFKELVAAFADAGHSRLPVFREDLDHVIGMIHIKDVFEIIAKGQEAQFEMARLLRQPLFVSQWTGVIELLAQMRAERVHLAIVLDEYSGTDGLITIEDLVEEIVGNIEDEHDDAQPELLIRLEDGIWEADARAELEDVGRMIAPALAEVEEDVDTLGGMAMVLAGYVPEPGEVLMHDSGWQLEIIDSDSKRILRIRLHPPAKDAIRA